MFQWPQESSDLPTPTRIAFEFVTLSDMIHVVWHYGDPWKVKESKERGGGVECRVNACKNVCLELPTRNILGNKFKHGNPKTFKMIPLGRHRHHTATRITSTRVEWMILCHSQAIPPWLSACLYTWWAPQWGSGGEEGYANYGGCAWFFYLHTFDNFFCSSTGETQSRVISRRRYDNNH